MFLVAVPMQRRTVATMANDRGSNGDKFDSDDVTNVVEGEVGNVTQVGHIGDHDRNRDGDDDGGRRGSVTNVVKGKAEGQVIQAGDIRGDIQLGSPPVPARRAWWSWWRRRK
jgi:hypothetical protein